MLKDFKWVIDHSDLPWLQLDLNFPYKEMLKEALNVRDCFVPNLPNEKIGEYIHKGWHSLCLHGLEYDKVHHHKAYGFNQENQDKIPYKWTKIADKCPVTTRFFKKIFPHKNYYRLRFMLLEAGGYIRPHEDYHISRLSSINFALNNPKKLDFKIRNYGNLPFKPGTAFLIDISNTHAIFNNSNEDRYHIIVHGNLENTPEYQELIERSYKKYSPNNYAKKMIYHIRNYIAKRNDDFSIIYRENKIK